MIKRLAIACFLLGGSVTALTAQAVSTASRRADLQIGVGFVGVNSDYAPDNFRGFALYTTYDVTNCWGGEFVFHQANSPYGDKLYERTYEIGPRFHRTYGRLSPYVKAMYGRGVFNFPLDVANLAYNLFAVGLGSDIRVLPYLNVRIDYEYQRWINFPPTGLGPQILTVGMAYHFPGSLKRSRHY